jgi:DNA-binding NarL/FixJ family response regulator
MMPIARVLLADDHAIVRAGLRKVMEEMPEIEIVGEVGDGLGLIAALKDIQPDFLVVDATMPNFQPISAIRSIKKEYPELKILIVSAYNDREYVVGLLETGVNGYHLKDQPLADLHLAIRRILGGDRWISGPLIDRLLHHPPSRVDQPAIPVLSRRQRELLRLLTQGCDNRKIAKMMDLSIKTVENQLTGLYRILRVESRLEALNFAIRNPDVLAISGQDVDDLTSNQNAILMVLVVDDSPHYRQQLCKMIGQACPSSRLYEAEDVMEAVRIAGQVRPHLALVDVVLKDEDGIKCVRRIKSVAPATRVVLVSAYPDTEFRRLGLDAGAIAFLDKKDIDANTIQHILKDTIGCEINIA